MVGNMMIGAATLAQNSVLAHQGGWDEVVLVGAPVVLFGGLLLVAKHRAQRIVEERGLANRDIEHKSDFDG